jgi:periplasmic mercuric ion binding protein
MKTVKVLMIAVMAVIGLNVFAQGQERTDSIKVYGNCGMCKKRIEKAVKLEGVKTASWDAELQTLTVTYDSTRITNDEIQKRVVAVGHDTEKYSADDAAYKKLPGCCLYDRKKTVGKYENQNKN